MEEDMDNYHYFNYSRNNPEEIFDPFYAKNMVVIPSNSSIENNLTNKNARMIECITAFKVLISQGCDVKNESIVKIVNEIVDILTNTKNINYSAFSQFFMVYNSTYSYFTGLEGKDRFDFVYQMLIRYCKERHDMYCSHGYTNSILQVMCDNYSHKRNGKTSIDKILSILSPYKLKHITNIQQINETSSYFLPDKGDHKLFEDFLQKYNLKMESRAIEQSKRPDIVFNCNGHYYICELKTMKGNGGGQNKQIVEVAYFIKFSEQDSRFHYVAFLDGDYANTLFFSNMPKIVSQRNDIVNALHQNSSNYFVNTAGFKKLIEDVFV